MYSFITNLIWLEVRKVGATISWLSELKHNIYKVLIKVQKPVKIFRYSALVVNKSKILNLAPQVEHYCVCLG